MAPTIEKFIEERIAEDERIAKDTSGTATEREWVYAEGRISDTGEYGGLHAETHSPRDGVHIARHDPARVLRQCAAMRRVVDAEITHLEVLDCEFGDGCTLADIRAGRCRDRGDIERSDALRALASIWSAHADYQAGWSV